MIKNLFFILISLLLFSCHKEGCTDPNAENYNPKAAIDNGSCISSPYKISEVIIEGEYYQRVVGTFEEDFTFTKNKKWLLSGGIFVGNKATLTIEAGTEVYAANDASTPFLSILRGGKINAVGTQSNPIVLTSIKTITGNPEPGDWGGLIINGRAILNNGSESVGEGGTGTYGGLNDNDNSGIIRYMRVEYAGKLLSTDNELNGFSFNGVGRGTTIEYIQAYKGADDGIEFFGGTVSVKYAVSTGNKDDSFDWTYGWRGNGQFWVAVQDSTGGDRGLEADNNNSDNTLIPYSYPIVSNITLIGKDDNDASNTGMRLREGTKGKIYNAIVTGFPKYGVRVSDAQTNTNITAHELILKNSIVYLNSTNWKDCAPFEPGNEITNSNANPMVLNGYIGTTTNNAFNPSSLDSWFTPATYIGAVQTSNDWTAGWTKK